MPSRPAFSQSTRQILAFTLFIGMVAIAMYLAFGGQVTQRRTERNAKAKPLAQDDGEASTDEHGFFYQSIGQAHEPAAQKESGGSSAANSLFTVELAVFEDRSQAESTVASLQAQGIDAYYTPLNHNGRVIFRVRRGLFPSQAEADQAALALRTQGQKGAAVVKLQ